MARILTFDGHTPEVPPDVFVADDATLIGKVRLGQDASVWFGAVLRGDVGFIHIGARTNVQDLAVLHMTEGVSNVEVGEEVTIGHAAVLHGCVVGDRSLIGIGAIVLDGANIGPESLIAAGALVPPRMVIPPRSFALGRPAKILRQVSDEELAMGLANNRHYVELAARYRTMVAVTPR